MEALQPSVSLTGGGQFGQLGALLQRACLVCCISCLPIYALWTQTELILGFLGEEEMEETLRL